MKTRTKMRRYAFHPFRGVANLCSKRMVELANNVANILEMEEIDLENIVGSRTRGKKIDFTKEVQKAGNELDEDDDDDGDFVSLLSCPLTWLGCSDRRGEIVTCSGYYSVVSRPRAKVEFSMSISRETFLTDCWTSFI